VCVETQQLCLAASAAAYICSTAECICRSSHLRLAPSSVQSTLQISMIWVIPLQPSISKLRGKAPLMRASKGQCLVLNAQAACCCKCAECRCHIKHQLECNRASTWKNAPGNLPAAPDKQYCRWWLVQYTANGVLRMNSVFLPLIYILAMA